MIDTHCHLDYCEPPVAELVGRARAAGVGRMATVAMNGASIAHALAAAEDHDEVVAIVGRHPHETAGFDELALEEIERAAAHPRVARDRRDRASTTTATTPRAPTSGEPSRRSSSWPRASDSPW